MGGWAQRCGPAVAVAAVARSSIKRQGQDEWEQVTERGGGGGGDGGSMQYWPHKHGMWMEENMREEG